MRMLPALLTAGLAAGEPGASWPWPVTAYEAEDMRTDGQVLGPAFVPGEPAAESSGRRCVRLQGRGRSLEWTLDRPANALVVRVSIPDAPQGGGRDATLTVLRNGRKAGTLTVSSRLSWSYGSYPFTDDPAAGGPRQVFDESRMLAGDWKAGDAIGLRIDAGDDAPWYDIDLVETEQVPPAEQAPAGAIPITAFGARPDDDGDDSDALRRCLEEAARRTGTAWLPPGTWRVSGTFTIGQAMLAGAGMWHARLVPAKDYARPGDRIALRGAGRTAHLRGFAITGALTYRNDDEPNDGIGGSFGAGSTITGIWVEHTKAGAWIVNSERIAVRQCRFRNTIADGINLSSGVRDSVIEDCTARGNGDDGFALWPALYQKPAFPGGGNAIRRVTASLMSLGNGIGIYGGAGAQVSDALLVDAPYGCGVLISTVFHAEPFSGPVLVERSRLLRCGGYDGRADQAGDAAQAWRWKASLRFVAQRHPIADVTLRDLVIADSASDGIAFSSPGGKPVERILLDRLVITDPGRRGRGTAICAKGDAVGSATTLTALPDGSWANDAPRTFTLIRRDPVPANPTGTP